MYIENIYIFQNLNPNYPQDYYRFNFDPVINSKLNYTAPAKMICFGGIVVHTAYDSDVTALGRYPTKAFAKMSSA